MSADLDALLISLYVLVDDLLPARRRFGRPPRISDSELICLAVAQMLLDCPNESRLLRLARRRLGHLFPYIPGQSGFNKRLRALAPQLVEAVTLLASLRVFLCIGGWLGVVGDAVSEVDAQDGHGGRPVVTGLP